MRKGSEENLNGKEEELSFKVGSVDRCLSFIERYMPPRNMAELVGVRNYARTCINAVLRAVRKDMELYVKLRTVLGNVDPSDWLRACQASTDVPGDLVAVMISKQIDCIIELLYSILSIRSMEGRTEAIVEQRTVGEEQSEDMEGE